MSFCLEAILSEQSSERNPKSGADAGIVKSYFEKNNGTFSECGCEPAEKVTEKIKTLVLGGPCFVESEQKTRPESQPYVDIEATIGRIANRAADAEDADGTAESARDLHVSVAVPV